jgi:predicted PurR-regulated permease PerM
LIEYIFFISKNIKNHDICELFFYFLFGYNIEQNNIIEEDLNNNNNNSAINYRAIISKANQNYESIRAFFTLILESNNINQFSLLIKTLSNLVKNIPYVFMSEMVVPYYLFYLNKKKNIRKRF